jgi:hypothetical protein
MTRSSGVLKDVSARCPLVTVARKFRIGFTLDERRRHVPVACVLPLNLLATFGVSCFVGARRTLWRRAGDVRFVADACGAPACVVHGYPLARRVGRAFL